MPPTIEATLRSLRKTRDLSLKDMAAEIGVTPKTVLAWEKGAAPPTLDHAERHRACLGIAMEDYQKLWAGARAAWETSHGETAAAKGASA